MARNIKSLDGTVQVVMDIAVLEAILDRFPHLDVFAMPVDDDIPTYGFTPKTLNTD